jgi:hypothetical protein
VGNHCPNSNNGHGANGNVLVVEGKAGRVYICGLAMVSFVLDSLCEELP